MAVIGLASGLAAAFKGAYAADTTYKAGEVVSYSGGTYLALQPTTGVAPVVGGSSAVWLLFVPGGAKGDIGPVGSVGPTGSVGASGQGLTFRGAWASGASYVAYDVVTSSGSTFIATTAVASGGADPAASGAAGWSRLTFGFNPKGAWVSGTLYSVGDVVASGGGSFLCVLAVGAGASTNVPVSGSAYWLQLTSGLNPRGAHAMSTNYYPGDLVTYNGSAYVCLASLFSLGVPPSYPVTTWMPLTTGMYSRGAWVSATQYYPGEIVTYGGSSFVNNTATASSTNPASLTANWTRLAGPTAGTMVVKTAAYTASVGELVLANASGGAFAVTLPSAPAANSVVTVKKTDGSSNVVTITPQSATIDGANSLALTGNYAAATLQFDGTNWQVIMTTMATGSVNANSLVEPLPLWKNGLWSPPYNTMSTANFPSTNLLGYKIRIPNACILNAINIYINSGNTASTKIEWYLYADVSNGPSTRLYSGGGTTPDATTTATTTGHIVTPFASPLTFYAPTDVWLLWRPNSTSLNSSTGTTPITFVPTGTLTVSAPQQMRMWAQWGNTTAVPTDLSSYGFQSTVAGNPPAAFFSVN